MLKVDSIEYKRRQRELLNKTSDRFQVCFRYIKKHLELDDQGKLIITAPIGDTEITGDEAELLKALDAERTRKAEERKKFIDEQRTGLLPELKQLLEKYNAIISFECHSCSDLQGIYGEYMAVKIGNDELIKVNGWDIGSTDI